MPMSTTWVFLGLLAGREIGIALHLHHRKKKKLTNLVFSDAGKAFFGSVVAIVLAMFLPVLSHANLAKADEPQQPAVAAEQVSAPAADATITPATIPVGAPAAEPATPQ
jgi:hypothetical protein